MRGWDGDPLHLYSCGTKGDPAAHRDAPICQAPSCCSSLMLQTKGWDEALCPPLSKEEAVVRIGVCREVGIPLLHAGLGQFIAAPSFVLPDGVSIRTALGTRKDAGEGRKMRGFGEQDH